MQKTTNHPKLKAFFDGLFLIGALLIIIKIIVALGNHFLDWQITFFNDSLFWMAGPLLIAIIGAIDTETLSRRKNN